MKNSVVMLVVVASLVALAGCAVVKSNPAHTTVVTPAGVYDYHCPPGQAKKGKC